MRTLDVTLKLVIISFCIGVAFRLISKNIVCKVCGKEMNYGINHMKYHIAKEVTFI